MTTTARNGSKASSRNVVYTEYNSHDGRTQNVLAIVC